MVKRAGAQLLYIIRICRKEGDFVCSSLPFMQKNRQGIEYGSTRVQVLISREKYSPLGSNKKNMASLLVAVRLDKARYYYTISIGHTH